MNSESSYKGILFDLDGVLVDTAKYHYLAWKKLAGRWGLDLSIQDNENLKGVSRVNSLHWILEKAGIKLEPAAFNEALDEKNSDYRALIAEMDSSSLLPGALEFLKDCKKAGYKMALASASKNAPFIIDRLGIKEYFQAIADGNSTSKSKPDPEVFLIAAKGLDLPPENCIAIEDSRKGIQAANTAGCYTIGIGEKEVLSDADVVFTGLVDFRITDLKFN